MFVPAAAPTAIEPATPLTTTFDDTLRFYLNGTRVVLDEIDPEVTLLEYLRGIGLTGTKLGCGEGGCGACTVVVSQYNPTTNKIYHASVNACLAPLASIDGKHVITIEGIGNTNKPHPSQERVAKGNGSQCGFCTPGIVMSLYALLRNNPTPTDVDVEEAFDGNLCRCTGYRSILDAAQTFNTQKACGNAKANGGSGCCMEKGSSEARCGGSLNETSQPIKKFTPPGFIEYNPDTELIFPPALKKHELKPLSFGNKRKRWFRPTTLDQLIDIRRAFPESKIIGGSTETQIEIKFKALQYPVSIYVGDISELRQYHFKDGHLEIGANISLTDLENLSAQAVEKYEKEGGQVFEAIRKQLKYFAGRQIRNVGTPAGNLVTASPISDLNPVFLASDCVLVSKSPDGDREIPMSEFFRGYRKTALASNGVLTAIRIPVTRKGEFLKAYKQAKRKDDDIAIVTTTMRVHLDQDGLVESCNLAYGGMAPMTISAKAASKYLVGKKFSQLETLEGAMNALEEDFNLPYEVPGGMASYRKTLALSFFYRFYHDVLTELSQNEQVDIQAVEEIERDISSGAVDEEAASAYELHVVGKTKNHLAAMAQTTGEARYTDDTPSWGNELHACYVLSTKAHAKVLSVDYSAALDVPGVDKVDINDLPSKDANQWGAPHRDEVFFADGEVFTVGQPIALIVATSALRAAEAARAVKVEYEDLPAVFTIEEAIEQGSFFNWSRELRNGNPEKAFKECDYTFTGETRMGGQEHFYLETNACIAVPKPEDGEMEIFSSTQNANEAQAYASQILGVSANKVVIRVKRLGGGFGGKETRSCQLSSIVALAAQKTKRPVRYMLTRDEDIAMSGQRHPFLSKWKVGVNKDGKLQAIDMDLYSNGGWTFDLSTAVCERAMSHSDGCYHTPNVHIRGRVCKTNTVSNTAFRGFGGPQGMFMAESFMEEVADRLDMPVDKFREINMYAPKDKTPFNQEIKDWHVPLMYQQLRSSVHFSQRSQEIDDFNSKNKWMKKGISLLPTKFGISFTALFLNQAGALVHIYHDGSVLVAHGGVEMGQGLHTKMTQIAAECLSVPLESVHISETTTNTVANASATAASASSDLNGYAIKNACDQLNARLEPYKQKLGFGPPHGSDKPVVTMRDLAHAAYFDRVNLSAQGFYKTPEIGYDWATNSGQMYYYFTQGVACAEVKVDTLTGSWTCERADVLMDVGRSINPAVDYGQIQGAFVQGMGLFTMEQSLWFDGRKEGEADASAASVTAAATEAVAVRGTAAGDVGEKAGLVSGPLTGTLATKGPGAYKIPGFRDIPQVFNVSLLKGVEWEELRTIQRSRGVGEPPLFLGASVFFAVRDALKAARKEYGVVARSVVQHGVGAVGDGVRVVGDVERERKREEGDGLLRLDSPATTERIRLACVDPIVKRGRVEGGVGRKGFFMSI